MSDNDERACIKLLKSLLEPSEKREVEPNDKEKRKSEEK